MLIGEVDITKVLEKIRLRRTVDLDLAWDIGTLFEAGVGYGELEHESKSLGIEPINKGRWKALLRIYDYFKRECGMDKSELEGISTSKLHLLAKVALPPSQLPEFLELAKHANYATLKEALEMRLPSVPLRERFRMIRVPESVYNLWGASLERLSEVVGESGITPTHYLEFLSELVQMMPEDYLRKLWRAAHGEG